LTEGVEVVGYSDDLNLLSIATLACQPGWRETAAGSTVQCGLDREWATLGGEPGLRCEMIPDYCPEVPLMYTAVNGTRVLIPIQHAEVRT
jgi:hypothetical protein